MGSFSVTSFSSSLNGCKRFKIFIVISPSFSYFFTWSYRHNTLDSFFHEVFSNSVSFATIFYFLLLRTPTVIESLPNNFWLEVTPLPPSVRRFDILVLLTFLLSVPGVGVGSCSICRFFLFILSPSIYFLVTSLFLFFHLFRCSKTSSVLRLRSCDRSPSDSCLSLVLSLRCRFWNTISSSYLHPRVLPVYGRLILPCIKLDRLVYLQTYKIFLCPLSNSTMIQWSTLANTPSFPPEISEMTMRRRLDPKGLNTLIRTENTSYFKVSVRRMCKRKLHLR